MPQSAAAIGIPNVNCWRRPAARRAAMLVDGDACFSAMARSMQKARRAIYIAGWDIHSRADLRAGGPDGGLPRELGAFLRALVGRRRWLRAHVLSWDYAMIYALEREPLPLLNMRWRTHRRVSFRLDGSHPFGACHHQKLVIVDDAVAYCGGLDLTIKRWDTPDHRADDPRRRLPSGATYGPFHDVQLLVDGEAAATLGALFRRRWMRATGEALDPPPDARGDPWPEGVRPGFVNVPVAIARTLPDHLGQMAAREVERLHLDAIAAARRSIYIENQYVTSHVIQEALARRLSEPDAPDVVILSPLRLSGWLEESTMGMLRARLIRRLREADRKGRLRFLYPVVPGNDDPGVNVHSKLMVVDDRALRVGSANLSNRSMGLDTECDLMLEADGRPENTEAIARARNTLLAEHLGLPEEAIAAAIRQTGSLIAGIERCSGGGRTLKPLPSPEPAWLEEVMPEKLVDPERPIDPEDLLEQMVPQEPTPSRRLAAMAGGGLLILLALALFGASSRWSFFGGLVDPRTLMGTADSSPGLLTPIIVVAIYLLAGLLVLPVTLLIVETAVLFGPWWGFLLALTGSMASALAFYGVGRLVGRNLVRRLPGRWLNRLGGWVARRGVIAVAMVRVLPLAPFTVVNVVAGASGVPFRDYALGTLIGMTPGIALMTAMGSQIGRTLRERSLTNVLLLIAIAALTAAAAWWAQRRLAAVRSPASQPERAAVPRGAVRSTQA